MKKIKIIERYLISKKRQFKKRKNNPKLKKLMMKLKNKIFLIVLKNFNKLFSFIKIQIVKIFPKFIKK
jgi:hypothetical protein